MLWGVGGGRVWWVRKEWEGTGTGDSLLWNNKNVGTQSKNIQKKHEGEVTFSPAGLRVMSCCNLLILQFFKEQLWIEEHMEMTLENSGIRGWNSARAQGRVFLVSPPCPSQIHGMALLYSYGHLCRCSQLSYAGSQPVSANTLQPPALKPVNLKQGRRPGEDATPRGSVHTDGHHSVLSLTRTCQPKHRGAARGDACFSISFSVISSTE